MKEFIKAMWNSTEFWIGWLSLLFLWTVLDLIGEISTADAGGITISAFVLVVSALLIWRYVHVYNRSVSRGKIVKEELGIVGDVKVTLR